MSSKNMQLCQKLQEEWMDEFEDHAILLKMQERRNEH